MQRLIEAIDIKRPSVVVLGIPHDVAVGVFAVFTRLYPDDGIEVDYLDEGLTDMITALVGMGYRQEAVTKNASRTFIHFSQEGNQ